MFNVSLLQLSTTDNLKLYLENVGITKTEIDDMCSDITSLYNLAYIVRVAELKTNSALYFKPYFKKLLTLTSNTLRLGYLFEYITHLPYSEVVDQKPFTKNFNYIMNAELPVYNYDNPINDEPLNSSLYDKLSTGLSNSFITNVDWKDILSFIKTRNLSKHQLNCLLQEWLSILTEHSIKPNINLLGDLENSCNNLLSTPNKEQLKLSSIIDYKLPLYILYNTLYSPDNVIKDVQTNAIELQLLNLSTKDRTKNITHLERLHALKVPSHVFSDFLNLTSYDATIPPKLETFISLLENNKNSIYASNKDGKYFKYSFATQERLFSLFHLLNALQSKNKILTLTHLEPFAYNYLNLDQTVFNNLVSVTGKDIRIDGKLIVELADWTKLPKPIANNYISWLINGYPNNDTLKLYFINFEVTDLPKLAILFDLGVDKELVLGNKDELDRMAYVAYFFKLKNLPIVNNTKPQSFTKDFDTLIKLDTGNYRDDNLAMFLLFNESYLRSLNPDNEHFKDWTSILNYIRLEFQPTGISKHINGSANYRSITKLIYPFLRSITTDKIYNTTAESLSYELSELIGASYDNIKSYLEEYYSINKTLPYELVRYLIVNPHLTFVFDMGLEYSKLNELIQEYLKEKDTSLEQPQNILKPLCSYMLLDLEYSEVLKLIRTNYSSDKRLNKADFGSTPLTKTITDVINNRQLEIENQAKENLQYDYKLDSTKKSKVNLNF